MKPLLSLGECVATPTALEALTPEEALVLLERHQSGDWGGVPPEDAKENEFSVEHGFRMLSSYAVRDRGRVWIIAEADKSRTTMLRPEEYREEW